MNRKASRIAVVTALGIIVVIASCVVWQLRNGKVAGPKVEEKVKTLLKTDFSFEFTNSWQTVNASGGLVGSPFYSVRWWREYFFEVQGDLSAYQNIFNDLDGRHWTTEFSFLPSEDFQNRVILTHQESTNLAPWWRPETNTEPMFSAQMENGGQVVFIYGFKKNTNALVYVHLIER